MKTKTAISPEMVSFFKAEIRNEDSGGDSPATLDSAHGSLIQAPDDVLALWCGCAERKNLSKEIESELKPLIKEHGGKTKLENLLK